MKGVKSIGLAVIAALAMTAFAGASSASASQFMNENPTEFVGVGSGTLKMAGNERTCASSFWGFPSGVNATSFTASGVSIAGCNGGEPLQMNGCKFTYKPGLETAPGKFDGTIDIGPAGCGPMTIKKWGPPWCTSYTYQLYPATGIPAKFTNVGSGTSAKVTIVMDASGLKVVSPGTEFNGCGLGGNNGSFFGYWEMSSSNGGVYVSGATGLFLNGKAFEGERSPQNVVGQEKEANLPKFSTTGNLNTTCKQADFGGSISAATSALPVTASYGECKSGTFPAVVRMNTCSYTLNVLTASAPYSGSLDIGCTKAGDSIEIRTYSGAKGLEEDKPICTVNIKAQTGLSSVGYANLGSGSSRAVDVTPNLSGFTYTYSRLSAVCNGTGSGGTFSDGKYVGDTTLTGAF